MRVFIFLGAPGAGKGTAAAKIAAATGAWHVSTGAMLRDLVRENSPAGIVAKSHIDKGELVPDHILAGMIGELFEAAEKDATFILDGFPRTIAQAEELDGLAAAHGAEIVKTINIEVPEDILLKRLGGRRVCPVCGASFHVESLPPKQPGICDICGNELVLRDDDKPETVKNRLLVYAEKTAPLTGWYERIGKLARADGSGNADEAARNVAAAMG